MNINKMLKGAVAALTSAAALGALTAPAFAASGTYDLNGKGVDARWKKALAWMCRAVDEKEGGRKTR